MARPDRSQREGRRGKIVARLDWESTASDYQALIDAGNEKRPKRAPDPAWTRHLENPVVLDVGSAILARAYTKLATARSWTFGGAGPIPIDVIWGWCDRELLERHAAEFAEAVLLLVDRAMIAKINARKD